MQVPSSQVFLRRSRFPSLQRCGQGPLAARICVAWVIWSSTFRASAISAKLSEGGLD
jgi:hypothetical protein